MGVPMPMIVEGDVDDLQHVPQERVQNSVVELIGGVPVPQIWEPIVDGPQLVPRERVQDRTPEQLMDSPVPQTMEAVSPELIVDSPHASDHGGRLAGRTTRACPKSYARADCGCPCASDHRGQLAGRTTGALATSYAGADFGCPCASDHGSVCGTCACSTTGTRTESDSGAGYGCAIAPHQAGRGVHRESVHNDHAFSDNVGFIRGLDKHNMPRLGDVMVPPPQIPKISWFDRKPQAAANEPFYRFQTKRSGRSSRSKLKR